MNATNWNLRLWAAVGFYIWHNTWFISIFFVPSFEKAAKVIHFNTDLEAQRLAVGKCCLYSFL